jgi:hypothetical protein
MLDKMIEVRRWEEFVLIHLSREIELDEPREVVRGKATKAVEVGGGSLLFLH